MNTFKGFESEYDDATDRAFDDYQTSLAEQETRKMKPIATITDVYNREYFGDDRKPSLGGSIDTDAFLSENVEFDSDVSDAWAEFNASAVVDAESDECDRLATFMAARGFPYKVSNFATPNQDNDLDVDLSIVVFARDLGIDWPHAGDGEVIVVVQSCDCYAAFGAIRFVTEFPQHAYVIPLTYTAGWWFEAIGEPIESLDSMNERIGEGYSTWPTGAMLEYLHEVYPDTLSADRSKVQADVKLPADIIARVWVHVCVPCGD